jgi:hypothetical protein
MPGGSITSWDNGPVISLGRKAPLESGEFKNGGEKSCLNES